MVGWYHQHNEFEQTLRDNKEQGSLTCCGPWGHKESDTTERLNNNNNLVAQLASIRQMSRQGSRGSTGEYQPDEIGRAHV